MTRIIGIDPGINGAISLIDTVACTLAVTDMPLETGVGGKNSVSATGVARIFEAAGADYTFIELVTSSPQMGVTSAFSFGRSLGILEGAAASRTMLSKPRPQDWKAKTITPKDKDQARGRAQQLFPCAYDLFKLKKHDGRAESALIAFYGTMVIGQSPTKALTLVDFPS